MTAAAYIDRLKKQLTAREACAARQANGVPLAECEAVLRRTETLLGPLLAHTGATVGERLDRLAPGRRFGPDLLKDILDAMHPELTPDTMCAPRLVDHVHWCVERVILERVPGDLIETGVWKGGMTVLMRGILKAYGITDRSVWVADSFEGLPCPDAEKNLDDAIWYQLVGPLDHLRIPVEYAQSVFRKYGLLDAQVRFLKGWFAETLSAAPIEKLALMRLDGDWYESTRDALDALYPRLSPGGWVIIDDYGLPFDCRRAVDEYRAAHGITEPILQVNEQAVCWQKVRPPA